MIPFVDLKAQYRSIREEVNAAIQGVLDSAQFTLGSEVAAFEREFAERVEQLVGVESIAVSVGPERGQTIVRKNPFRHG